MMPRHHTDKNMRPDNSISSRICTTLTIKRRDTRSKELAILQIVYSCCACRAFCVLKSRELFAYTGGEFVKAVRFVTTYCRQSGKGSLGQPIREERIDTEPFEATQEIQVTEMWLQGFLGSNKPEMAEAV